VGDDDSGPDESIMIWILRELPKNASSSKNAGAHREMSLRHIH